MIEIVTFKSQSCRREDGRTHALLSQLIPVAIAVIACTAWKDSSAFHDGGVGHCSGCHTSHNSQDGIPGNTDTPGGVDALLLFENPTDLCLSCHAVANGEVLSLDPRFPSPERGAGNFGFLLEDNLNDGPGGAAAPIDGSHAGHNVASLLWGIPVDPVRSVAPGGTYPADNLTCTSCHDPHGNSGFRMLRGRGSTDASGFRFTEDAPLGEGIPLYGAGESPTLHTAYHQGWSDWCGNCHGRVHHSLGAVFEHPTDSAMDSEEWANYNDYDGPEQIFSGDYSTAYLPEVPLEDPTAAIDATVGATGSSRVMCLTCHRAHATSAPSALRWDPSVEFLADDGQVSGSYPLPSPYPDPEQRSLCVKCHFAEAYEHGFGRPCMECHRD